MLDSFHSMINKFSTKWLKFPNIKIATNFNLPRYID